MTSSFAILTSFCAIGAHAQSADQWPNHRVSIMVGFAAGGYADNVARIVSRNLGERWKQAVAIQNMAGAGGNIAARSVSVAPPDGYTILATTTGLAINETLYKNKGFTSKGLVPIALPIEAPELLATNAKGDIRTFEDVLKVARSGKLFMSTSGIGSGSHISAEYLFKILAKVEVKHIPFPGGNPAMLALMTGDVNLTASTATVLPSIINGELIGIGVGSTQRMPMLPNVPTYIENGFPGFTASSWVGFFAPAGTPDAILDKMNADINESLSDPEVKKQFQTMGLISTVRNRTDTTKLFNSEVERWGVMVNALNLSE